ncbi:methylated-DNA--[protein]-cysteine S-methyltransferase [Mycoplasmatota bacterium WC30]
MKKYTYDSKIGKITIFADEIILHQIKLESKVIYNDEPNFIILNTITQLDEYFDNLRTTFDLPFNIVGTDFEKEILSKIIAIPYGETRSYKELASAANHPGAFRATGTVCKNNKLPLIIPCHRVIKSDGSIGEYLGGKAIKKSLIELENKLKSN